MGCDIHSFVEVRKDGKWEVKTGDVFPLTGWALKYSSEYTNDKATHTSHPFDWRSYGMFGFLANIRNYSHSPVIQEPTYEVPMDASEEIKDKFIGSDRHTHSYLTLRQLAEYEYDQKFWDRRVSKGGNGAALAEEGEGETVVLRDFLGKEFFDQIEVMKTLGDLDDVRVIFCFDN